jgi:hypothetical protein
MKQLLPLSLFLFLLPCLAWAQYPSNGNQKITLGEQTTADGLIYRGVLADTGIITPLSDTSAYIILDTVNHRFYNYNRATNVWSVAGGGTSVTTFSAGTTGLTPSEATSGAVTLGGTLAVANGGTGLTTFSAADRIPYTTSATALATSSNLTFNGSKLILLGNQSFTGTQSFINNEINSTYTQTTATNAGVVGAFNSLLTYAGTSAFSNSRAYSVVPTISNTSTSNLISGAYYSIRTSSSGAANILNALLSEYRLSGSGNVTDAKIISGLIFKDGAGTLTNGYGFKIEDITNTSGTITNTFGIHVGDITSGTQTNKAYSLYISDQNSRSYINSNTGFGALDPTARLHLAAGTATASTGPLKFTSGTNLTTAEAGAMEFNGTNLFFSPSTTRHTINHGLTGSATLNFPSTLTMLSADLTITVTGAADGDVVSLGVPNAAVNANTFYSAWVSAANTVTVRFNNYSIGTVDPASALFKVFVTK